MSGFLTGLLLGGLLILVALAVLFMWDFQIGPWRRMAAAEEAPPAAPTRKPLLRLVK